MIGSGGGVCFYSVDVGRKSVGQGDEAGGYSLASLRHNAGNQTAVSGGNVNQNLAVVGDGVGRLSWQNKDAEQHIVARGVLAAVGLQGYCAAIVGRLCGGNASN